MPVDATDMANNRHLGGSSLSYKFSTWAIIISSLICAFFVYNWVTDDQKQKAQTSFNDLGQQISTSLERQLRRTEDTLTSIVAFFVASDRISRQEFSTFVSTAMSERVGVQALEWIPRVADKAKAAYEHAAQGDGLVNFAIRQAGKSGMETASKRAEYYPVYYVEPLAGNEKAVGFDLASNTARKAALEKARDTGSIVSSARITLVQETAKQAGVVVFAPIYGSSKTLETVPKRRVALTSFALGVFRIGDLLETSISDVTRASNLIIALYDASDKKNRQPMHLFGGEGAESQVPMEKMLGEYSFQQLHKFGGRDWRLVITPKGGTLPRAHPWYPLIFGIGSFAILFLIGSYIQTIIQRGEYAEGLVIDRTQSLKASEARVQAIVENIFDGIITINDLGIIKSINSAVESIFGYTKEQLIGQNVKILTPEPHQTKHDTYLQDYLATGHAKIIGIGREVEGLRANGSKFPMELEVAELWLGDKRLFLGVVRDITERKEVEMAKTEFVSTVSHELRTPLTSIKGSLGLIRSGTTGELPEKMQSMLDIA
ncbi:MAG: CHASE domain-containing protein, partial [Rhodospirillales bacterium]